MEPKKTIKKHYIIDHESELNRILDSAQEIIRRDGRRGTANWIFCSEEVNNMINHMYEEDEIEIGEVREEDGEQVQDITLRPRRVSFFEQIERRENVVTI